MKYSHLGRSGLKVPPLCLGTMNFGRHTSEEDSHAIMDRALEAGVNFFDTANVYSSGRTETIIGNWFARGGERREDVVLATKVFARWNWEAGDPRDPNMDRGLSARKIVRHCEESLRRLQTDYIDLYQMHHVDRNCPVEEILRAMDLLVTQGKVLYIGSSNFAGWDIALFNEAAARRESVGLISEQSIYNLTNRMVELEVIPACRHYGLGLIPWSPLASGILGGVLDTADTCRRNDDNQQKRVAGMRTQLDAWEALCRDLGQPPATVALAWLLHNPAVTAPIIGPRTMDQLVQSLAVPDLHLDDQTLKKLDEIFPGPGGEAPKAYAW